MSDNIIFCFYFDEYDSDATESGLLINSTKHLASKLKYYKTVYIDNFPNIRYYIIDKDCHIVLNEFKNNFKTVNISGCYDMIIVNYTTIETYFTKNNIKYTLIEQLDNNIMSKLNEPLTRREVIDLINENTYIHSLL